jgi:hypothetical protein
MKGRITKYAVLAFVVASLGVTMQMKRALGQGPGPHGPGMGPGNFAFERIVGGFGGKVVTGAPFSAQVSRETIQVLSNGTKLDQKESGNMARDAVGRTRNEVTLSNIGPLAAEGEGAHIAFIRDPVAGKSYILNEDKKTAMTLARPTGTNGEQGERMRGRRMGNHQNANVQTTSLGTKVMDGLTVNGTQTTRTIPAGQIGNSAPIVITRQEWYSPDLQMVISSTRTDPRFGTTTYQLTNINRSDPPQSLFTVPSDYTAAPMRFHGGQQAGPGLPDSNK